MLSNVLPEQYLGYDDDQSSVNNEDKDNLSEASSGSIVPFVDFRSKSSHLVLLSDGNSTPTTRADQTTTPRVRISPSTFADVVKRSWTQTSSSSRRRSKFTEITDDDDGGDHSSDTDFVPTGTSEEESNRKPGEIEQPKKRAISKQSLSERLVKRQRTSKKNFVFVSKTVSSSALSQRSSSPLLFLSHVSFSDTSRATAPILEV